MDNYCKLSKELIENNNISAYKIYNKSLYVIKLKKIYSKIFIEKSKWGFFYECDISNLKDIDYFVKKKTSNCYLLRIFKKIFRKIF